MISIEAKGAKELAQKFRALTNSIPDFAVRVLKTTSFMIRQKLVERMTKPGGYDPFWGKQSPAGAFLGARTGRSAARIVPGAIVRGNKSWSTSVGSPDEHIRFHEYGGTIHGRQFLRIPTAAAQSASGAEQGRFAGRSLRNVPGVFLMRTKTGHLWAAEMQGKKLTLLFLLARAAKFRPRGIFAAVANEIQAGLDALGATEMKATIRTAGLS